MVFLLLLIIISPVFPDLNSKLPAQPVNLQNPKAILATKAVIVFYGGLFLK